MRPMRKEKRQLSNDEAYLILKEGEYGTLSMVSEGKGYGVPMSYANDDNYIYLHCAVAGQKLDAVMENDNVSFSVVGKTLIIPESFSTKYESVIVQGKIEVADGERKVKGLKELVKKYSPHFVKEGDEYIERAAKATRVLLISIDHITGKASK